jgi:PAS domain S-box-containing protein
MTAMPENQNETVSANGEITENELSFYSLFSSMTEGVAVHHIIYDPDVKAIDYIIREVNPSFEKNLGIPADKARGALASELYGMTPPPYLEIYDHVVKTGEPYFFTTYFEPLDRYFEISVFLPKHGWFATVFLDVSGSKRAAEDLRATGIKYRRLYESMMDGFARTDMNGAIREFNSCFRDMLGYSEEELLKMTYRDITPEHWHGYEERIIENQVIPYGYSGVFEKEYRKKDGTVFPIELRISLIRNEHGKPDGMWGVIRDISERKRSENELEKMIDRFNLATRSGNMGVWEWDILTNQMIWDDKMLELYGVERDKFYENHSTWESLLHPDDVVRMNEEIRLAFNGEKDYDCDFRIVLNDGSIRFIKAFAQVVRDTAGNPLRMTGINFDITAQKKIQESLLISEMFNRGLVESAPVGILFLDRSGLITYENPAMRHMMGIPDGMESIVIGKLFRDLPPIKAVISEPEINRILGGERLDAREIHYRSLRGNELDLEVYTAPLLNNEKEVYGTILMAVDITKPVAAGKGLRESEQKYRRLYESIRDGFMLLDMQKHPVEFNSFFLTMTGYSAEEVTRMKSIREIVPEKWHSKVDGIIKDQIMVMDYSDVFEIEYIRKDGSVFPVEVRLFLIKNPDGKSEGMWTIVRDITERKKMENKVNELNAALGQKVEEKTKELQERVKELERFYTATIDREMRMKEMRTRIEELEKMNR